MDVLVAVLICAILFLLYLLNENKNEVLRLKREHRENERDNFARPPQKNFQPKLPPSSGIFVSVIFKEHDTKSYDYLLGDNRDVQVGDFVIVYASNVFSKEVERRVAQVVYVSKPGEVSDFAKTVIKCKSDRTKW